MFAASQLDVSLSSSHFLIHIFNTLHWTGACHISPHIKLQQSRPHIYIYVNTDTPQPHYYVLHYYVNSVTVNIVDPNFSEANQIEANQNSNCALSTDHSPVEGDCLSSLKSCGAVLKQKMLFSWCPPRDCGDSPTKASKHDRPTIFTA